MIRDGENILMNEHEETTATTHYSDYTIDLVANNRHRGQPIYLLVSVADAVTSDGAATVTFGLQTDADEDFSDPTTVWQSSAIGKATLVAGYRVAKLVLPGPFERYIRGFITIGAAALTAGSFNMELIEGIDDNPACH